MLEILFFTLYLFGVIFALLVAAGAAWSDITGMIIDNILSILTVAAFVLSYGGLAAAGKADAVFSDWWWHLLSAGIVLAVTMGLFALGRIGAGDSKFASACALWAPFPAGLVTFLFSMALAGGVLAIVALILQKWKPFQNPGAKSWAGRAQAGEGTVPYAVAIAVALVALFVSAGYFNFVAIGVVDPSRI